MYDLQRLRSVYLVDRRTFIYAAIGGIIGRPKFALAQQAGKMPLVGILNSGAGPRSLTVDITRQGLRDLGYVDGQTIAFDVRFAGMNQETLPGLAADLIERRVDVILVSGPAAARG
jgi:putative ABC transport system substrate-binding protein